jgi:CRISPR-associated protein Cmr6
MRSCLRRVAYPNGAVPSHFALAYDAWAPVADGSPEQPAASDKIGKVPDENKAGWLERLEQSAIADDYRRFYDLWKGSFSAGQLGEIELTSRLLVGHGNASATDVGLTVHHTWGVPMIPGSALKGLCAHYAAATYGSKDHAPTDFAAPVWEESRVVGEPGRFYRALFGTPDVNDDVSAGLVVFPDALYVPGSTPGDKPFAVDVLTVHQRSYYGQDKDRAGVAGERWPNDYDSPNPVGFMSVRPGTKLLIALGGDPKWAELALALLTEAISEWGVGGKTSAGYGRGRS